MPSRLVIGLIVCLILLRIPVDGKTNRESLSFDKIFLLISSGALEKAELELEKYGKSLPLTKNTETECLLLNGLLSFSKFEFEKSMGQFNEAETQISLSENPELNWARLNHFKGILFLKGFYKSELAVDYLKLAEQVYVLQKVPSHYLADIYFQLGRSYKDFGDIGNAKYYILKSLDIYEGQELRYPIQVADNINTLAIIALDVNQIDEAIRLFTTAILQTQQYQKDHLLLSKIYDNLGWAYRLSGNETARLSSFRKSIIIAKKYSNGRFWASNSYMNLGEYFLEQKRMDSAIYYFRKCSKARVSLFSEKNYEIAQVFQHLGISFRAMHNFDSALFYLDKAFEPYQQLFSSNPLDLRKPEKEEYLISIDILSQKTQLFIDEFISDRTKIEKLKIAHFLFQRIDSLAKEFSRDFFWDTSHNYIHDELKTNYERAIYTAYLLYQETQEESYALDAFELMEHNKSQILLQNLGISKGISKNPEAIKMRSLELSLKKKLTVAQLQLSMAVDPTIQKHIVRLSDSLSFLFEMLKKSDNNYYTSRFKQSLNAQAAQQFLAQHQLNLIEFFYGRDAIYSIALNSNGVSDFQRIKHDDQLDAKINSVLSMVSTVPRIIGAKEQSEKYTQLSNDLYRMILEKPLRTLTTNDLIIIPDGKLFNLPVEALTQSKTKSSSFSQLDYVQMHYVIAYAYSCASLLREGVPTKVNKVTAAFGDTSDEIATNKISALEEINALSEILPVRKYFGLAATKSAVLKSLLEDEQIHFALHGKASTTEGKSYVVLPGLDTLFAYEIYGAKVNANLVHLNACETMAGAGNASEGVISLARAFIFAGARSVITNLWLVDDTHARTLAINFYKGKSKEVPPANALALAKRAAIENGDQFTAHPYYWAGTILMGQPNTLTNSSGIHLVYYCLLVLLLLITIILWKKKEVILLLDRKLS